MCIYGGERVGGIIQGRQIMDQRDARGRKQAPTGFVGPGREASKEGTTRDEEDVLGLLAADAWPINHVICPEAVGYDVNPATPGKSSVLSGDGQSL